MNGDEIGTTIEAALLLCALAVLRSDILYLIRRPSHPLYGDARLGWTWGRSLAGLVAGPLLLAIPLGYGLLTGLGTYQPGEPAALLRAVLIQGGAVIGTELFLREAAVKAFAGHLGAMVIASVLACFVYHMPQGVPAAMMAAGAGAFYLALRLAGVNILAVVLVHAIADVGQNQVIPLSLAGSDVWQYAIWFTVVAAILALSLFSMTGPQRREGSYA